MRPQVGQLVNNKYRLVRMLGDGGMGSVFEARHEVLGSSVALKFLHPELARRQGLVQRFLQEARVSAKIQSVHVVRVTDVEQTAEGLPFMVMELLSGKSLQASTKSSTARRSASLSKTVCATRCRSSTASRPPTRKASCTVT